jgi:hypothetical protein
MWGTKRKKKQSTNAVEKNVENTNFNDDNGP